MATTIKPYVPSLRLLMGYDLIICGWNKFHPYNMIRAYGSWTSKNEIQRINPDPPDMN